MKNYRRVIESGGSYFFTVVTQQRQPVFKSAENIALLKQAFQKEQRRRPFTIDAIVILPDHIHAIWTLPTDDHDYASRWREIKKFVTRRLNGKYPRPIWQARFWEHLIRDETDWLNHLDYVHYNPVKHGYCQAPAEWPWSSFHRCVEKGWYEPDWGTEPPRATILKMDFE